jgi:hypothetical protein
MKFISLLLTFLSAGFGSLHANPEIPRAVTQSFGAAVGGSLLLVKGSGTTSEPVEWTAYARDVFHPEEILRIMVRLDSSSWMATPAGAGTKVLSPAPPRTINSSRLLIRSSEARTLAAKAAALAQTTFVSVEYQLAANADTGAPEWGLALKDASGFEVGFCIVSAETGALTFQDWTLRLANTPSAPPNDGERAAKAVKKTIRKAWNWTDKASSETRSFFKELFR